VISRAFSEIGLFLQLTQHLIAKNGRWLAMKGVMPVNELENLPQQPIQILPLNVAGLNAERHLLVFEKHV
jgi:16S rRNA (guanine527-N7)-methyltransferase